MNDRSIPRVSTYLPYLFAYGTAAVVFLLVKGLQPEFSLSFLIKAIPALSLTLAVLSTSDLETRERVALVAGALLCGTGDVILDIDRVRLFVPGLAAFLLGHVGFLVFFAFRFTARPGAKRSAGAAPVLLLAVGMAVVLIPKLGSLLIPVLAYLLVITAMTILAVFSRTSGVAAVGAFIFMISDALLALAKFVFDGSPSPMVTIPVYFAGLGLLGFGIVVFQPQFARNISPRDHR